MHMTLERTALIQRAPSRARSTTIEFVLLAAPVYYSGCFSVCDRASAQRGA
jgi:hypothetical protein